LTWERILRALANPITWQVVVGAAALSAAGWLVRSAPRLLASALRRGEPAPGSPEAQLARLLDRVARRRALELKLGLVPDARIERLQDELVERLRETAPERRAAEGGHYWTPQQWPGRLRAEFAARCEAGLVDLGPCRVCGCSADDCSRCASRTGTWCWWVEADLCSACAASGVLP
jgi:hypothetical protein